MELIYKSRIEAIANRETGYSSITENRIVNEARQHGPSFHRTSVFLSHSHLDAKIVKPVVVFLRSMGVDVYVDWMDITMSQTTNGETAQKLKTKIKENEKFIFLATENSLISKWCNWEVGYGDAHKYIEKIAIFPLLERNRRWNGQEYLQIYPCIQKKDYGDYFYVVYPNGISISLVDWLKK